jgi:hypothetical protein
MQVLTTSTSEQSIKVTTRESLTSADIIALTNENTKVIEYIAINSYSDGGYYTIVNAEFNLSEGVFYTFKIKNGGTLNTLQAEDYEEILTEANDVIELDGVTSTQSIKHYGRIFCTDQTNYDINNNEYTSKSSNNDFIFL